MKKFLCWLTVFFALVVGASAARAAPSITYGFSVDSLACSDPLSAHCAAERDFYTQKLESMTLSFDRAALSTGHASILIDMEPLTATTLAFSNDGFAGLDLAQWGVATDLAAQTCLPYCFKLEAAFGLPGALTGLLRLDTWSDNLFMSASAANLWSGYINSDGPYMTYGEGIRPSFVGAWRLRAAEVPEPDSLALLGAALCGLLLVRFVRQRKHARR